MDQLTDLFGTLSDSILGTSTLILDESQIKKIDNTIQENSIILGDGGSDSATEIFRGTLFELDIDFIREDGSTGDDGHILDHSLAVVTKARGLDGTDLDLTTELVKDTGSKSITIDIFSDNQERAAAT